MSGLKPFFMGVGASLAFSLLTGIMRITTVWRVLGFFLSMRFVAPVVVFYALFILGFSHIAYMQEVASFNKASWGKVVPFAGLWAAACCVFMLAIEPFSWFFPEKARMVAHRTTALVGELVMRKSAGWNITAEGLEKLPKTPVVFVINHQSMIDIGTFILTMPKSAKYAWVSKDSVFWAPGLGSLMSKAEYIPLKRKDKQSIHEMFQLCHQRITEGWSIIIFPSGTRRRNEQLPFKYGAFQLAYDAKLPVVPVSISVPKDVWFASWQSANPPHIHAIYHDAITTHLDPNNTKTEKDIVTELADLSFKAINEGLGPDYYTTLLTKNN